MSILQSSLLGFASRICRDFESQASFSSREIRHSFINPALPLQFWFSTCQDVVPRGGDRRPPFGTLGAQRLRSTWQRGSCAFCCSEGREYLRSGGFGSLRARTSPEGREPRESSRRRARVPRKNGIFLNLKKKTLELGIGLCRKALRKELWTGNKSGWKKIFFQKTISS